MKRPSIPSRMRRSVLARDEYTCQECSYAEQPGAKPSRLELHHLIPWALCHQHAEANLLTLCADCHKRWRTDIGAVLFVTMDDETLAVLRAERRGDETLNRTLARCIRRYCLLLAHARIALNQALPDDHGRLIRHALDPFAEPLPDQPSLLTLDLALIDSIERSRVEEGNGRRIIVTPQ